MTLCLCRILFDLLFNSISRVNNSFNKYKSLLATAIDKSFKKVDWLSCVLSKSSSNSKREIFNLSISFF